VFALLIRLVRVESKSSCGINAARNDSGFARKPVNKLFVFGLKNVRQVERKTATENESRINCIDVDEATKTLFRRQPLYWALRRRQLTTLQRTSSSQRVRI